jgi:hypothetical protein
VATAEAAPSRFRHPDLAARRFRQARRGDDPAEVRRFLEAVARLVGRLEDEIERLRARSEYLEKRHASAGESAYDRLAREFVEVVRVADRTAQQVRRAAETRAADTIHSARAEADQILAAARKEAEGIRARAAEADRLSRQPVPKPRSSRETNPHLRAAFWTEEEESPRRSPLGAAPPDLWGNGKRSKLGTPTPARLLDLETVEFDPDLGIDLDIDIPSIELDDPPIEP